jgi:hypothetical protein
MKCAKCGTDVKEAKIIKKEDVCYKCACEILDTENVKIKKAFNEIYTGLSKLQLRGFKIMLGDEEND